MGQQTRAAVTLWMAVLVATSAFMTVGALGLQAFMR